MATLLKIAFLLLRAPYWLFCFCVLVNYFVMELKGSKLFITSYLSCTFLWGQFLKQFCDISLTGCLLLEWFSRDNCWFRGGCKQSFTLRKSHLRKSYLVCLSEVGLPEFISHQEVTPQLLCSICTSIASLHYAAIPM